MVDGKRLINGSTSGAMNTEITPVNISDSAIKNFAAEMDLSGDSIKFNIFSSSVNFSMRLL